MLVRCAPCDKPLLFADCGDVLDIFRSITDGWSFRLAPEPAEPSIRVLRKADGFAIEEEGRAAIFEESAVSAACSLVAILLNRMVEDDADRLCLHAGAVEIGGQTLAFPSTHRAGKSTLVCALALRGAALVADDILPLHCGEGGIEAIASGVAPRLRLPLARPLGLRFRLAAWRHAGPDDGYYRYIRLPTPNRRGFGARCGLAGFILLERAPDLGVPELHAVSKASAMRALLLQNFGRAAPSGVILDRIERLADEVPAFLLRYGDLPPAVALLRRSFGAGAPMSALWQGLEAAEPDLGRMEGPEGEGSDPCPVGTLRFRQSEGVVLREVDGAVFLADESGRGIFALDPLGGAIWRLMEEPGSAAEIAALVADAYPGIAPGRIAVDVDRLIEALLARGLVRPAEAGAERKPAA